MIGGTWHEGGPHQSAELIFQGTAVYVFCAIPTSSRTSLDTSLTFFIDNSTVSNYNFSVVSLWQAPSPSGFLYHVPVLAANGLPDDTHVLRVMNNGPSDILLDEITYTYSEAILDASKSGGIQRRVITGGSTYDTGSVSGGSSGNGGNTLSAGVIVGIVIAAVIVGLLIMIYIIVPCVSACLREDEPPKKLSSSANPGDTKPQVAAQPPQPPQMKEGEVPPHQPAV
ncbi:hypothetical protein NP233_g11015 [Leucocoprinus birnbaumii]|uniref:Uncharacterized protein n=1 Tax=Leucocoprinus birnbaumii TaxID=56174 RepID=A0AAD5VJA5_9AGAR|nr:hypothetical protein NP233_g11015 [Leucocoprinus birnbaumii]